MMVFSYQRSRSATGNSPSNFDWRAIAHPSRQHARINGFDARNVPARFEATPEPDASNVGSSPVTHTSAVRARPGRLMCAVRLVRHENESGPDLVEDAEWVFDRQPVDRTEACLRAELAELVLIRPGCAKSFTVMSQRCCHA